MNEQPIRAGQLDRSWGRFAVDGKAVSTLPEARGLAKLRKEGKHAALVRLK